MPTDAPDERHARLEFETLIADTSALLISADPEAIDAVVTSVLERLRVFFDVDRAGLLQVSEDRVAVRLRYAAYGPGIAEVPQTLELERWFPWTNGRALREHQPVVVGRLEDLPLEAATDRETFRRLGVLSNLTVPIVSGSTVTHLVAMGTLRREKQWPAEYLPRVRLLGEVIVGNVARSVAFGALKARESELLVRTACLDAAVEAAGIGFWEWEVEGSPPCADPTLQNILGLEAGGPEPLEMSWLARIDRPWVNEVREQGRQLLAGEVDRAEVEYRYEHPTRGWIWLRRAARRLTNFPAGGRGVYLIATVQDITEARRREEALRRAHEDLKQLRDQIEQENVYLRTEMAHRTVSGSVAGKSAAIRHALSLASQVARADTTVLLTGETGTGKERFASFIHEESDRRSRHMVRVNCSAIPSALIESELFGREKGAYTGALTRQAGRFELAHRSTLFLDEIGDLPQDVQVKLLRVLQEKTIERLGSPTPVPVDVRIIAATNRDLDAAVHAGTFRSDLFYRLNVFPVVVPPLRERREDIASLVEELIRELNISMRKRIDAIDRTSLEAIVRYDWPGNVRELRNVIERAMILSPGPTLKVDVPAPKSEARAVAAAPAPASPPATIGGLQEWEREHILRVLEATGWRIRGPQAAAEVLGLKPTTLEKRMVRLGIQRPSTRRVPLRSHE